MFKGAGEALFIILAIVTIIWVPISVVIVLYLIAFQIDKGR